MTTVVSKPDTDARRGLWLAGAGVLAVPVTGALLAATPTMARATVYVVGLAAIAAISFLGGRLGRRALAATIVGLWLGLTAAVLCFWTLLALVV